MRTQRQLDADREWRRANRARLREYERQRRAKNPQKMRANSARYAAKHPEKIREAGAKWRAKNPNYSREYTRKLRTEAPDKLRAYRLKHHYDLTIQQKDTMFEKQGRTCAICKRETPDSRGWVVDHEHVTGAVRGILCSPCNGGLGFFLDRADVLRAAIAYLEKQ